MEPIIPMPEDILNKNSGIDNLNFLLHYPKVYVMDNHLAAGWCWLQELDPEFSYCFFMCLLRYIQVLNMKKIIIKVKCLCGTTI